MTLRGGGGFGNFQRSYPQDTPVTFTFSVPDSISMPIISGNQRFVGWKLDSEFLTPDMSVEINVAGESQLLEAKFLRAGDFNDDNQVNLVDFSTLATCYGAAPGSSNCSAEMHASVDLDRSGTIDLTDFAIFSLEFGT